MSTLETLYAEFSKLATAKYEVAKPPTADDLKQAASALGHQMPKDFLDFLSRFHDRHPPFWDVLRVQRSGSPTVGEDLVKVNLDMRKAYRGELERCVLFFNDGTGRYACFVFSKSGKFAGIGRWDPFDDDRERPPEIRYDTWRDWLAAEVGDLRNSDL